MRGIVKLTSSVAVVGLFMVSASYANPFWTVEPPTHPKVVTKNTVFYDVTNHKGITGSQRTPSKRPDSPVKVAAIDGAFDPHQWGVSSALTESYLAEVSNRTELAQINNRISALVSNHANGVVDIIAGKDTGISPSAKVRHIDAGALADKKGSTVDDALVQACQQAINSKANFVNISLRMNSPSDPNKAISSKVRDAFLSLSKKGIVVYKSAGNDGELMGSTPYTRSLAKLAQDMGGHLHFVVNTDYKESESVSASSNKAGSASKFTVAAPGTRILAEGPMGLEENSGTSFAAPIATGIAAKVKAQYPHFSNREVAKIVAESARKSRYGYWFFQKDYQLESGSFGQGVVNLKSALELAELKSDESLQGKAKLVLHKGIEVAKTVAHHASTVAKTVGSYVKQAATSALNSLSSWWSRR